MSKTENKESAFRRERALTLLGQTLAEIGAGKDEIALYSCEKALRHLAALAAAKRDHLQPTAKFPDWIDRMLETGAQHVQSNNLPDETRHHQLVGEMQELVGLFANTATPPIHKMLAACDCGNGLVLSIPEQAFLYLWRCHSEVAPPISQPFSGPASGKSGAVGPHQLSTKKARA